jgi:hypothetical protein
MGSPGQYGTGGVDSRPGAGDKKWGKVEGADGNSFYADQRKEKMERGSGLGRGSTWRERGGPADMRAVRSGGPSQQWRATGRGGWWLGGVAHIGEVTLGGGSGRWAGPR